MRLTLIKRCRLLCLFLFIVLARSSPADVYFELKGITPGWNSDGMAMATVELTTRDTDRVSYKSPIRLKCDGTFIEENRRVVMFNKKRDVAALNVRPSTKSYKICVVWSRGDGKYVVDQDFGLRAQKLAEEHGIEIEDVASLTVLELHGRTLTLMYHTWAVKGSFTFDVQITPSGEVRYVKGSKRKAE